ncbi:hypothetical protein EYF80_027731 [Liparis tanakae]|uniref:Uncharacterized protein n=1 Tax=Liparis tanakae TaxID=230148 RepID=A0A4Z2H954_9TELE|nr:hypothetical protein EYF80_027731 [Liparis tanakae]
MGIGYTACTQQHNKKYLILHVFVYFVILCHQVELVSDTKLGKGHEVYTSVRQMEVERRSGRSISGHGIRPSQQQQQQQPPLSQLVLSRRKAVALAGYCLGPREALASGFVRMLNGGPHVPSQLICQLVDARYRQRVSAAAASRLEPMANMMDLLLAVDMVMITTRASRTGKAGTHSSTVNSIKVTTRAHRDAPEPMNVSLVVGSNGHHDFCCVSSSRGRTSSQRRQICLDPLCEVEDITGGEEVRATDLQHMQNSPGQLLEEGHISVPGTIHTQLYHPLRKRGIDTNVELYFPTGSRDYNQHDIQCKKKNYNSHSAVQAGEGCCTAERDEADEGEDRIGAQESSDIMLKTMNQEKTEALISSRVSALSCNLLAPGGQGLEGKMKLVSSSQ